MATKKTSATSNKIDRKELTCKICGKKRVVGQFYESKRVEHDSTYNKAPYCKSCLQSMSIDNNLRMVTPDTLKKVLKLLDKPFINSIFVEATTSDLGNDRVLGKYLSALNLKSDDIKNATFSDTIMFEIKDEQLKNSKSTNESECVITDSMKRFWGHGKRNEDYIELQSMYDSFMENEEDTDIDYKKQSDYKTLCELEIMKRSLILDGSKVGDLAKVVDMISKLSSDLNIKAIQKKEDNSNKGAYDLFIKKIEQTKPVFDFERDLGNKDEVKELLQLYFYAYLMDVNNQRTQFTDELHGELNKYTPDLKTLSEEDGESDG